MFSQVKGRSVRSVPVRTKNANFCHKFCHPLSYRKGWHNGWYLVGMTDRFYDRNGSPLAANFALEEGEAKFPSGAALKKLLAQRGVEYKKTMVGAAYIGVSLPKELRTKVPLEVVK